MITYTNKYAYEEGIKYASKLSLQDLEYSMSYMTAFENRVKMIISPVFPIDNDPRKDRLFGNYFTELVQSNRQIDIVPNPLGTCRMNEYFKIWEHDFILGVRTFYMNYM